MHTEFFKMKPVACKKRNIVRDVIIGNSLKTLLSPVVLCIIKEQSSNILILEISLDILEGKNDFNYRLSVLKGVVTCGPQVADQISRDLKPK